MVDYNRAPAGYYRAEGMIKNVNTIEGYRDIDKAHTLQQSGKTVGFFFFFFFNALTEKD